MNGKEYADHIGVPHGTVKRWLGEGLPAERGGRSNAGRIDVAAADAWIKTNRPNSVSFGRSSLLYVVVRSTDAAVKIGWTSDLERRLKELRRESHAAITLLTAFPGNKPDELRLHARFAEDRITGEWFRSSPTIRTWLHDFNARAA